MSNNHYYAWSVVFEWLSLPWGSLVPNSQSPAPTTALTDRSNAIINQLISAEYITPHTPPEATHVEQHGHITSMLQKEYLNVEILPRSSF